MQQPVRGVAKKEQIKLSQPYRLGERPAASASQPKARVLQHNDESAVIEEVPF